MVEIQCQWMVVVAEGLRRTVTVTACLPVWGCFTMSSPLLPALCQISSPVIQLESTGNRRARYYDGSYGIVTDKDNGAGWLTSHGGPSIDLVTPITYLYRHWTHSAALACASQPLLGLHNIQLSCQPRCLEGCLRLSVLTHTQTSLCHKYVGMLYISINIRGDDWGCVLPRMSYDDKHSAILLAEGRHLLMNMALEYLLPSQQKKGQRGEK